MDKLGDVQEGRLRLNSKSMREEREQLSWDDERDPAGCGLDSSTPLTAAWHKTECVAFHLWSDSQTERSRSDLLRWDETQTQPHLWVRRPWDSEWSRWMEPSRRVTRSGAGLHPWTLNLRRNFFLNTFLDRFLSARNEPLLMELGSVQRQLSWVSASRADHVLPSGVLRIWQRTFLWNITLFLRPQYTRKCKKSYADLLLKRPCSWIYVIAEASGCKRKWFALSRFSRVKPYPVLRYWNASVRHKLEKSEQVNSVVRVNEIGKTWPRGQETLTLLFISIL